MLDCHEREKSSKRDISYLTFFNNSSKSVDTFYLFLTMRSIYFEFCVILLVICKEDQKSCASLTFSS